MTVLFWCCVAFVALTYLGYPLAIGLLSKARRPLTPLPPATGWPSVSVVCAAHNEAGRLDAKIQNLLDQRYPGPLQLVFVSDGSTDETDVLLTRNPAVTPVLYAPRRGKPYAIARGVERATGDVLVMTDARQSLAPGAMERLVGFLQHDQVGLVSGSLVHRDPATRQARDVGLYWRYERAIRQAESRWYSTVGTTGALYALRRVDFVAPPEDAILDDFEVPMQVLRRGRRTLIDEGALIHDDLQPDGAGEARRKLRTLAGNYQSFLRHGWLWWPGSNPVWAQWLLHKVCRLLVPWALLLAWIASGLSTAPLMRAAFVMQTLAYLLVPASRLLPALRTLPLLGTWLVFVDLNLAAIRGLLYYLRSRQGALWEKTS
ncbi:MAG: hypothetical protein RL026_1570 [Pseudomonadota bacterium]|jgi:cellulose synthase/poly-beta-1,6-N-acetylglucosamine synthase-like glycosyltransferase